MISRSPYPRLPLPLVGVPVGAVVMLLACSSSEDAQPDHAKTDAGQATAEGGTSNEPAQDAGADGGDAGEVVPPPYDFTVNCAVAPCVTQIAARGGMHACAVVKDGSVRCWGSNASGQLGTGGNDGGAIAVYEGTPRSVVGLSSARGVSATGDSSGGTTCVVSGAGEVVCFGSNAWGQLGRASASESGPNPDPAVVEGIQAKSVTLTSTFALAIGADDRLWSWGTNDTDQLARDVSVPDAGSPKEPLPAGLVSSAVRSCAGTSKTGFALTDEGVLSWGGGAFDQLGRPTSLAGDPVPAAITLSGVSNLTTGAAHACALGRGEIHCWGKNGRGQLGTGRKADEVYPARVVFPAGVYPVAVAAGGNNTCAIAGSGDVYCWGANGGGQLGTTSPSDQPLPDRIEGLAEEAVGIAVMDEAICALLRGGWVACWGDNLLGQLGRGSRDLEAHPQPAPVLIK